MSCFESPEDIQSNQKMFVKWFSAMFPGMTEMFELVYKAEDASLKGSEYFSLVT
jgi:hypothetical protein